MRAVKVLVMVMLLATAACSADGDDDDLAAERGTTERTMSVPDPTVTATTMARTAPTAPTARTEPRITAVVETTQPTATVPAAPEPTAAAALCPSLTLGVNDTMLTAGGATHPVRVFVPSAYAGSPLPVVIDWHGLGSNGPDQALYSGYEDVAESEGFIVAHPTGVVDVPGGPTSWQLFPADRERDDLGFAGGLIDELVANWCADPRRVYSTGMSNGGFFTARLICEMADRIAAGVSVAGTYHPDSCRPTRDVPYVAIHGTADRVVPYAGGDSTLMSADSPGELSVFFEHVMPDEFDEFAVDAGCDTKVDSDVGEDVIRHEYIDCDGDTPLIFYEVRGGGHTWPSSPIANFTEGALGYTTDDIDATRDGWAFMSRFTLPTD
jgi:polyhydroxybutyrate depolymerase